MPITPVRSPDGKLVKVKHPEGASPDQIIEFAKKNYTPSPLQPVPQTTWDKVRPYVEPVAEIGGLIGGGIAGGAGGAVAGGIGAVPGMIAGASLGYAGARKGLELADHYLNDTPLPSNALMSTASDLATGAAMEMGGQLIARGVGAAIGAVAHTKATRKAAQIVKDALGPDLQSARMLLRSAKGSGEQLSAGQATVEINSPQWQALMSRAMGRDPRFRDALKTLQQEPHVNAMRQIAKGSTETQMRTSAEAAHTATNKSLAPDVETALSNANIAGKMVPKLEAEITKLRGAASNKVTDVSRYTDLAPIASKASETWRPSTMRGDFSQTWNTSYAPTKLPLPLRNYTYPKELEKRALRLAQQSADDSLIFGEAARFKEYALSSLEKHGLRPLKSETIVKEIEGMLRNPKIGPDPEVSTVLSNVSKDIQKWTNANGVIDGHALDIIRKKSVNAATSQLMSAASRKEQRSFAASVTRKVSPLITDAIEQAGGTGYRAYLEAHGTAMHQIAVQRLTGKALRMYEKNPASFVELVEGNNPKIVEKVLGTGKYDLAKEVSDNTLSVMQSAARTAVRDIKMAEQSSSGTEALRELLTQEMTRFRLPSYLSVLASSTNKALDIIEKRLGRRVMNVLTDASKDPARMDRLLDALPAADRAQFLDLTRNPNLWQTGAKGAIVPMVRESTNALSVDENQNALRQ